MTYRIRNRKSGLLALGKYRSLWIRGIQARYKPRQWRSLLHDFCNVWWVGMSTIWEMIYQIIQIYRANMLLCPRLLRTVGSLFKVVDAVCGISHTCTANCAVLELRHNTTCVLREVIDENRCRNNTREKNNKKKNNYRVAEHGCSKAIFNINSVQFNSCSLTYWLKASTNAFKIIADMEV